MLLVEDGGPAALSLAADWRELEGTVVLGFQPDSTKASGFAVRHLLREIPPNWDVTPFVLSDVHGEPTLRLGMIDRGQQPLGKGMSGGPALNRKCEGDPAIAIVKAIEWPDPSELPPPEVKPTALHWLRLYGMIDKLPAATQVTSGGNEPAQRDRGAPTAPSESLGAVSGMAGGNPLRKEEHQALSA